MITKQTIAAAEKASFDATFAARRRGASMLDALAEGRRAYNAVIAQATRTVAPLPSSGMVGPRCVDAEDE